MSEQVKLDKIISIAQKEHLVKGQAREAIFSFRNSTSQGEVVQEIYQSPAKRKNEINIGGGVASTKYNSISKKDRSKSSYEPTDMGSFEVNCQIKTIQETSAKEGTMNPSLFDNQSSSVSVLGRNFYRKIIMHHEKVLKQRAKRSRSKQEGIPRPEVLKLNMNMNTDTGTSRNNFALTKNQVKHQFQSMQNIKTIDGAPAKTSENWIPSLSQQTQSTLRQDHTSGLKQQFKMSRLRCRSLTARNKDASSHQAADSEEQTASVAFAPLHSASGTLTSVAVVAHQPQLKSANPKFTHIFHKSIAQHNRQQDCTQKDYVKINSQRKPVKEQRLEKIKEIYKFRNKNKEEKVKEPKEDRKEYFNQKYQTANEIVKGKNVSDNFKEIYAALMNNENFLSGFKDGNSDSKFDVNQTVIGTCIAKILVFSEVNCKQTAPDEPGSPEKQHASKKRSSNKFYNNLIYQNIIGNFLPCIEQYDGVKDLQLNNYDKDLQGIFQDCYTGLSKDLGTSKISYQSAIQLTNDFMQRLVKSLLKQPLDDEMQLNNVTCLQIAMILQLFSTQFLLYLEQVDKNKVDTIEEANAKNDAKMKEVKQDYESEIEHIKRNHAIEIRRLEGRIQGLNADLFNNKKQNWILLDEVQLLTSRLREMNQYKHEDPEILRLKVLDKEFNDMLDAMEHKAQQSKVEMKQLSNVVASQIDIEMEYENKLKENKNLIGYLNELESHQQRMLIYEDNQPLVFNRLHYGAVENCLTPFVEIELLVRKFKEFEKDRYKEVIFGVHTQVNYNQLKVHLQTISGFFQQFIHNLALKHHKEQFKQNDTSKYLQPSKTKKMLPYATSAQHDHATYLSSRRSSNIGKEGEVFSNTTQLQPSDVIIETPFQKHSKSYLNQTCFRLSLMKVLFKKANGHRSKMYEEMIRLYYMNSKYIKQIKNSKDIQGEEPAREFLFILQLFHDMLIGSNTQRFCFFNEFMVATLIKFMKSPQRWESHSLEGDHDRTSFINQQPKKSLLRHANTAEGLGMFAQLMNKSSSNKKEKPNANQINKQTSLLQGDIKQKMPLHQIHSRNYSSESSEDDFVGQNLNKKRQSRDSNNSNSSDAIPVNLDIKTVKQSNMKLNLYNAMTILIQLFQLLDETILMPKNDVYKSQTDKSFLLNFIITNLYSIMDQNVTQEIDQGTNFEAALKNINDVTCNEIAEIEDDIKKVNAQLKGTDSKESKARLQKNTSTLMNQIKGNKAMESLFNLKLEKSAANRSHGSMRIIKKQDGIKFDSGNFDGLLGLMNSKKFGNAHNVGDFQDKIAFHTKAVSAIKAINTSKTDLRKKLTICALSKMLIFLMCQPKYEGGSELNMVGQNLRNQPDSKYSKLLINKLKAQQSYHLFQSRHEEDSEGGITISHFEKKILKVYWSQVLNPAEMKALASSLWIAESQFALRKPLTTQSRITIHFPESLNKLTRYYQITCKELVTTYASGLMGRGESSNLIQGRMIFKLIGCAFKKLTDVKLNVLKEKLERMEEKELRIYSQQNFASINSNHSVPQSNTITNMGVFMKVMTDCNPQLNLVCPLKLKNNKAFIQNSTGQYCLIKVHQEITQNYEIYQLKDKLQTKTRTRKHQDEKNSAEDQDGTAGTFVNSRDQAILKTAKLIKTEYRVTMTLVKKYGLMEYISMESQNANVINNLFNTVLPKNSDAYELIENLQYQTVNDNLKLILGKAMKKGLMGAHSADRGGDAR